MMKTKKLVLPMSERSRPASRFQRYVCALQSNPVTAIVRPFTPDKGATWDPKILSY